MNVLKLNRGETCENGRAEPADRFDERLEALTRAAKRPVGDRPSPFESIRNRRLRQEA